MRHRRIVLAALFAASAAGLVAQTKVYRIELVSGGILWSDDQPLQSGQQILFHGHPASSLKSMRRADIKRIVAVTAATPASSAIRPGEAVDVGLAGPGGRGHVGSGAAAGRAAAGRAPLRPSEGKGATALFNPDRDYRPDWDGKLVPGATMGLPNSPNYYRDGATLAHPAASAVVSAPGEPPTMKPFSGEPPKSPNQ